MWGPWQPLYVQAGKVYGEIRISVSTYTPRAVFTALIEARGRILM